MPARPLIKWLAAPALIILTTLAAIVGTACSGRGSASAMASGGPTVIATIPVGWGGYSPAGVAVNPATNRIYVANVRSDNVSVIDGASPQDAGEVAKGSGWSPGSYAVLAGGLAAAVLAAAAGAWYARRRWFR